MALTAQAEKELLKFKRGIEKLLPEKARKELGVMTGNELFGADLRGESDETLADR